MQMTEATVLVVDDEPGLLYVFRAWLERAGCRVMTAENGAEGLELATQNQVDAIVSDIRMPVMDGFEMARRLNATGAYVAKIVFVSGFSDVSERDCYDLGVQVALQKPTGRLQLLAAVRKCLMDREEAWREPPAVVPVCTMMERFVSAPDARRQGLLAFGRGGCCLQAAPPARAGDAIGLSLAFEAERHTLRGAGVVRWSAPDEALIGVEIVYVDDENRGWVAAQGGSTAFIPRSIGRYQGE
jgi:CheY-like chemotaxis protein